MTEGDFDGVTSYLPMPFEHGARITVENDGNIKDFVLFCHVEYEQYAPGQSASNAGRLHAQWRRVAKTVIPLGIHKDAAENSEKDRNTTGDDNYVILETRGQGSYIGLFLTVDNSQGGWYGEGDDMIFVDGLKWPPTYPGTGHEEVFDEGCCPTKEFSGPYTGFYLIENRDGPWGGKNQMYRFSVNNPVHFQKSIRVTVEHGNANNYESDYTSTAFWYQKDPYSHVPLPPAKDRLPMWPAGVVAEAIEKEANLYSWGQTPENPRPKDPPGPMNDADSKALDELGIATSKAFREFHYED